MKIILMSIENFTVIELDGVTDIHYDTATKAFTITHSGGTGTYSGLSYRVNILW